MIFSIVFRSWLGARAFANMAIAERMYRFLYRSLQYKNSRKVLSNVAKRIIVIDDEPDNVGIVQNILKMYGYSRIDSFTNPIEPLHEIL